MAPLVVPAVAAAVVQAALQGLQPHLLEKVAQAEMVILMEVA
jgi:hypothetical protein